MGVGRKNLILAIGFGLACGIALLLVSRLLAALSFFLGYDSLKDLFFRRIGLTGATSDFIAGALLFFLPMATYVLFANVLAVWSGRADARRVIKVFARMHLCIFCPPARQPCAT
jgi:hypothetical protein